MEHTGAYVEESKSSGHDAFTVMRHSSQDDQQAVGHMSQGDEGSIANFK